MEGKHSHQDSTVPLMTTYHEKNNQGVYTSIVVADAPLRKDERETWGKNFEFLLSVIGFAVDLGSVWRFPYICYSNGGGAFLIPFCVMFIFGGLPLFYLELALGQYQRVGCISVWKRICPIFKGIGYGICFINFYVSIYYNTVMAWAMYYFFASWKRIVPWATCTNEWNTANCIEFADAAANHSLRNNSFATSASQEYFNNEVLDLDKSDGIESVGTVKWSIALCLLAIFVIVYFSLWKGIKSSGKAVWVTAIFPYIVLIILLVRGVTLEGAKEGIIFYISPDWKKLANTTVWIEAAAQVFFSLGPGFGVHLALASYNKFNNNCYRDALITSTINCMTSFLAGFAVFSGLGFMATKLGVSVKDVATQGPGLAFEVYPEVIAQLPGSPFFAVVFFLMLITLGLDSTFGGLEAIITGLTDEWTVLRRKRELLVAGVLTCSFLTSLATTTYGGKYIVQLLDRYAAPISILFIVFLEAVAVCWLYGFTRFMGNVKSMLGFQPGIFWKVCWACVSPLFLLALFILSLWQALATDELKIGDYIYPRWCTYLGWLIVLSSVLCVPFYAIYKLCITPGLIIERIKVSIRPEENPEASDDLSTTLSAVSDTVKAAVNQQ